MYLQQVTAENDKLKKYVALQDRNQDNNSVALQAMQNQIAILEKENELLQKKMNHFLDDSSVDDMANSKESEKSVVAISSTELAELKALEMIRKLLDSVKKHYGQDSRVQEAMKELSTKKRKMMQHTCTDSDMDQSCISKKQNEEIATKMVKVESSDVCDFVMNCKTKKNVNFIETKIFSTDVSGNGTSTDNVDS